MDGTLETIDGRPALRFERRLGHPVERVWRAIRFELSPDDEGCVFGAQHAAGWEAHFGRLDALLAGTPKGPDEGMEGWGDIHERYAEKFGLDPEVGRRALAAYRAGGPDAVLEEMDRS